MRLEDAFFIEFNTYFDPEDDLRDDISYGDYLYEDE